MTDIYNVASGIFFTEFDSNTGAANLNNISGWLYENLGRLNVKLNTCFSGHDARIDEEAQTIFSSLYMSNYYSKQARQALRGIISDENGGILSLNDGDSSVKFTNKNEVSKVFKGLANDVDADIKDLVYKYNMYEARPVQVVVKCPND